MLFAHAFSDCDTTSRIFGVGIKSVFQKVVNGNSVLRACSKIFCAPKADQDTIESIGCKAMVSLFNGTQLENLESLHYSFLCKKVATAKDLRKTRNIATNNLGHKPSLSEDLLTSHAMDRQELRHGSY